jgi:lipid A 3-O-deacylase
MKVRSLLMRPVRASLAWFIVPCLCAIEACSAAEAGEEKHWLSPSSIFVQLGLADSTETLVAGLSWDWSWRKTFGRGQLGGDWEMSVGRWSTHYGPAPRASAWITQIGLTPVLRWYTDASRQTWFAEGGIGLNWLLPIYRSGGKRFSTTFNFGDHLAFGRRFGSSNGHEIALRYQHFSNAGIDHPNPGENFVQLRYSCRF